MSPKVFADRMRAAMAQCDVFAHEYRDRTGIAVLKDCLVANGFGEGVAILDRAADRAARIYEDEMHHG